jgi:hypothetical protein
METENDPGAGGAEREPPDRSNGEGEATRDPSGPAEGDLSAEQEELQRRLEEQLRKVRVQDLLLESVASILNLAARRIAKPDERDLEQGRVGIEAVRAVLELLEPTAREQVREALSQVQMLYAREARGAEGEAAEGAAQPPPSEPPAGDRPSGLWTPPGT